VLAFLASCWLLSLYEPTNASLQFSEYFPLNPDLGSAYALGVDGLSMPMLMLATLLTVIALLASFTITDGVKGYHICMLLLEFGMLGVFLAQDWALFYIFCDTRRVLILCCTRWAARCLC
jgi:NADH-quinone oxidoreductase subunit M